MKKKRASFRPSTAFFSCAFLCLALLAACGQGGAGGEKTLPGAAEAGSRPAPAASAPPLSAPPGPSLPGAAPKAGAGSVPNSATTRPADPAASGQAAPAAADLLAAFEAALVAGVGLADEAAALQVEDWARAVAESGGLDAAIARLEAAAGSPAAGAARAAPPTLSFALAALYGRKGLEARRHEALVATEAAAKARPDIAFNLAVVYGRKETQKSGGKLEDLVGANLLAVSLPPGARVLLDGQERGSAPLALETKAGPHRLRFEMAGREPREVEVELQPGQKMESRVDLRELRAKLVVVTEPAGATVTLSPGGTLGKSPVEIDNLAPGWYHAKTKFANHKEGLASVELAAGETRTVIMALEALGPKLLVRTKPEGALIIVDGKKIGRAWGAKGSPFETREVLAGSHKIRLELEGYEPLEAAFDLPAAGASFEYPLSRILAAVPRGSIAIDGKGRDWEGLAPLFTDPAGDDRLPAIAGTDVTAVYLCADDSYLYWRADFADGSPKPAADDRLYSIEVRNGEWSAKGTRLASFQVLFSADSLASGSYGRVSVRESVDAATSRSLLYDDKAPAVRFGEGFMEARYPISLYKSLLPDGVYDIGFQVRVIDKESSTRDETAEIGALLPRGAAR